MELDPFQMGLEFGGGGILGFVIGYATKKIAKLIAIIIGAELALFRFLETKGVLSVNWDALADGTANLTSTGATNAGEATGYVTSLASAVPIGGGFAAGTYIGFKKG
ncbi:FUN14 domain-containing protein [Halorutilales archaeon Cl-col2-1]